MNMEKSIMWFEAIQAVAGVVTAIIAWRALESWKRQDKAKREAEFLDALVDASHAYIAELPAPITLVQMAKIGMESHIATWKEGDQTIQGAIAYIEKHGKDDSRRLYDSLERVRPLASHLIALCKKGDVFNFRDYEKCRKAVLMLTWQKDRIEAFAVIIGSTTMNWEHPDVLKQLNIAIKLNPFEIRRDIEVNNTTLIEFSREIYGRIYR
jgi:hypothetical protein